VGIVRLRTEGHGVFFWGGGSETLKWDLENGPRDLKFGAISTVSIAGMFSCLLIDI
jgi:hypothetical protein